MTIRTASHRYGRRALAFGFAGFVIYMVMITLTLAEIEAMSGHIPFDMRPFGYGPQAAKELLDALGEEGRRYYLTRQIPLDTIYPALLAATLISMIQWLGVHLPHDKLMRVGIVTAVGAAFFDYVENLGIIGMIVSWPDLPELLVDAASSASIAKSSMTLVAVSIVLCLAAAWVWRVMKLRR